jgi:hypothetical protein
MTPQELVIQLFPGKLKIPMVDAGEAIGLAKQTSYNLYSQGTFPLPVQKQGRRSFVLILDLIAHLGSGEEQKEEEAPAPRRRGRPTREEVRRAELAKQSSRPAPRH